MPFVRPPVLENVELTDSQKRQLSKNYAKEQMNNYDLDEDARKAWRAEYSKFLKEDVKREQNVFTRMVDKAEDFAKQKAAQAGQFLTNFSQR